MCTSFVTGIIYNLLFCDVNVTKAEGVMILSLWHKLEMGEVCLLPIFFMVKKDISILGWFIAIHGSLNMHCN